MTYSEYLEFVRAAAKCSDLEEFTASAGEHLDNCDIIFAVSRGDLKKLVGRQSARAFGLKYGIPDRTVQLWIKGERSAPEYLFLLLGYAIIGELGQET